MEELFLREQDDFIRLGQALKKTGLAENGADAHRLVEEGAVLVNGKTETRRGKKLYPGDVFIYNDTQVLICR